MALFGFRKRRPSRVTPAQTGEFVLGSAVSQPLANRSVWLRVGMCGAGAWRPCRSAWRRGGPRFPIASATLPITGSWPASISAGSTGSRPTVRGPTPRRRLRTSSATIPKSLALLPAKLRANLREIADAKSLGRRFADDPRRLRTDAGRPGRAGQSRRGCLRTTNFRRLRRIVTDKADAPGNRIDDIVDEFTNLIAPLKNRGLADVNEFTLNKIRRRPEPGDRHGPRQRGPANRLPRGRAAFGTLETDRNARQGVAAVPAAQRPPPLVRAVARFPGAGHLELRRGRHAGRPPRSAGQDAERDARISPQHHPRAVAAGDRRRAVGRVEGRARRADGSR